MTLVHNFYENNMALLLREIVITEFSWHIVGWNNGNNLQYRGSFKGFRLEI